MKQDQAKEFVKQQLLDYLKDKGIDTKKPFNCLNPLHNDKKPSMNYDKDRNKCHCFSCKADYDTFDLISIDYHITGQDLFKKAFELYNIDIESDYIAPKKQTRQERQAPSQDNKADLQDLNNSLNNKDKAVEYLSTTRNINIEYLRTLDNIGYYEEISGHKNKWLTIKTDINSFIRRNADIKSSFRFKNYGTNKPSKLDLLLQADFIIIVESYIDLMTIESLGYKAIALNSISNGNKIIDYIKANKDIIKANIILCLDNDEPGQTESQKIQTELNKENITAYNLSKEILTDKDNKTFKDTNDFLKTAPDQLKVNIDIAIDEVKQKINKDFEDKKREWEKDKIINYIPRFLADIEEQTDNCIQTGFKQLDKILDGGLYPGLYTIGAVSSLGKTNFILQIADQIAQNGGQVLYFSLEMSKAELLARSISRLTYQLSNYSNLYKTTRQILRFKNYDFYSEEEKAHIFKAIKNYGNFANNINISEGIGNIGIEEIERKIKQYIYFTGKAPIVFIDYLQLLNQPKDIEYSLTDKQITDKNILALKRLSRDYKTPIIVVSSFNRDNYKKTASMQSFKESGAIEYSSDILISLEYKALQDITDGQDILDIVKREYSESGHNDIKLKVIKNRNGIKDNVEFRTNGAYSIFEELEK